mgnify:CR=1 FL=1
MTFEQAHDEILGMFKTAWDTTGYKASYTNVTPDFPDDPEPWARPKVKHHAGGSGSLTGASGSRRYERPGLLIVQIFVPKGEGLSEAYSLGKVIADAYEGQSSASGAWFRNIRPDEVGEDGDFEQLNMLIDFTYDEVK